MSVYKLRIKLITISKSGITVEFSNNWQKVWHFLPGSLVKDEQQKFRKAFFPGMYNYQKLIELLQSLPAINDKKAIFEVDEEDDLLVYITKSYRKTSYNIYGDKPIRHPEKFITKSPKKLKLACDV